MNNHGVIRAEPTIGTDYTLISALNYSCKGNTVTRCSATLMWARSQPRGVIISKSSNSEDFNTETNVVAKAETTSSVAYLTACGDCITFSANVPIYVWAKAVSSAANTVTLTYDTYPTS